MLTPVIAIDPCFNTALAMLAIVVTLSVPSPLYVYVTVSVFPSTIVKSYLERTIFAVNCITSTVLVTFITVVPFNLNVYFTK